FMTVPFGRSGTPPFAHRSAALGGLEALAKEEAEQRKIKRPPAARVRAHLRVAWPDAHADAALPDIEADAARQPLRPAIAPAHGLSFVGAPKSCSDAGIETEPSASWKFSMIASIARPVTAVPFRVCTVS